MMRDRIFETTMPAKIWSLMALLGTGEMTVNHGGGVHRYQVAGGFVQVAADVVRVVTERADETI